MSKKGQIYWLVQPECGLYGRLTGQSLTKIGLSVNTKKRYKSIQKGVKKKIIISDSVRVWDMRRTEKFLHSLFAESRTTRRDVGRSAGKTEWFYLNPIEELILWFWFSWLKVWYYMRPVLMTLLLIFVILFLTWEILNR